MDNLTHSVVGLAAAKAGLERLSPFATTVCILAANAPDIDVGVGLFADRWTLLKHHRGITHSIVGTLALGILVPIVFFLVERAIARWRNRRPRIRLRGLLAASLIAAATHPVMDWTNNYGLRPLLPWDGRWFYGDLVFILDPYIWLVVGGAAFLLTSNRRLKTLAWSILAGAISFAMFLAQANRDTGSSNLWPMRSIWLAGIALLIVARVARLHERFGRMIATGALAFVVLYWAGLGVAHHFAFQNAEVIANGISAPAGETVMKIAAMPTLADPGRWVCVTETDRAVYRFFVRLGEPGISVQPAWRDANPYRLASMPGVERFPKAAGPAEKLLEAARHDRRAKIFLGFARFPVAKVEDDNCVNQTLVQFADIRYTEPGPGARRNFAVSVPVECPQQ